MDRGDRCGGSAIDRGGVLYLLPDHAPAVCILSLLLDNSTEIRPGWKVYRLQAGRFFWLNMVVGFCFFLLAGLMALPFAAGLWRLFREVRARPVLTLDLFVVPSAL